MEVVAYIRVSTESQNHDRQKANLVAEASSKGWTVKRTFEEKISGTINASSRSAFNNLLKYVTDNNIKMVMVSEISRLGRRVVDVLNTIEKLHQHNIGLYVQQFRMSSLDENGKEDPVVKLLLQMLSMGAEMENNLRRERQRQGIEIARLNNVYQGRKPGARPTREAYLAKYKDVVDLIRSSNLSLRRISSITGRSINTVRKVKGMVNSIN